MSQLLKKLIETATAEIGVREANDNSGARVVEYQRATTLGGTHWPWCAAFVAWCIREACKALKIKNPWCNAASCDVILAWSRAHNIAHDTPQPGDVFLVMASTYDATHTGLVTAVKGANFTTIEGNTNLDGSREGIGVFRRQRVNGNRYLFVRWLDLCEAPKSGYEIHAGSKTFASVLLDGAAFVPVRLLGEALGRRVEWNEEKQVILMDGIEFPRQLRFVNHTAHAPARQLAEFLKVPLTVDNAARIITIGA